LLVTPRGPLIIRVTLGAIKLLVTVPFATRLGGAENMLWTFLRHVDRRRLEPVVVFLEEGPFEREVAALGIPTAVREAGRLRDIDRFARVVRRLAGDLRRECPDVMLNWTAKTHLYGAPAAALMRMSDRVVWWQHTIPSGDWLERLATALPARAVGVSSHASACEQRRLRPRRRTFVVHPGIESHAPVDGMDVVALRRGLAVPAGRALVGCVGRLEPGRSQHRFLHALATLRRRGCDVHGVIVGGDSLGLSGAYADDLKRLVGELQVQDAVTFTGHVPDAKPYIAMLDVLVAPGAEAFGIALLEAMVAGVPIVAVSSGGAPEIIEAGRSGLLVPAGDETRLAEAVERLIGDGALRERLRRAGPARVRSAFGAEGMTDDLQRHLEDIGRGAARRRSERRAVPRPPGG
jgi:glycosyltransferase involved in cell wall biosynthesis